MMQQICEGWELTLEAKHKRSQAVTAEWNVVVITTNLTFDEWYNSWDKLNPSVRLSMLSRIPPTCWETIDDGIDHRKQTHVKHPTANLTIVEL